MTYSTSSTYQMKREIIYFLVYFLGEISKYLTKPKIVLCRHDLRYDCPPETAF